MVWYFFRASLLIIFFIISIHDCISQLDPNAINLLRNGGFEIGNNNSYPQCGYYSNGTLSEHDAADLLSDELLDWNVAKRCSLCSWGSPDWFGPNCSSSSGGTNITNYIHLASENELIYSQLFLNGNSYSLTQGQRYILKFKYRKGSVGNSNFGLEIWFTKHGEHWFESPNLSSNQKYHLSDADVLWSDGSDNIDWHQKIVSFNSPFGSDYDDLKNIVFVLKSNNGQSYTRIDVDDVELYEDISCPDILAIENRIHWLENSIYQAADILKAGYDVNNPHTDNGNVEVKYNSNIIYRAGNQIVLEPGFSTEYGCYFETVIEPCEPNPCPNIPTNINNIIICDANPISIGNPNAETGLFYSWSPATYLDDPNSPNPIFTPPIGSGIIDYTVTITSICGNFITFNGPFPEITTSVTEHVQVNYHTNPDPNPSVLISNYQSSEYDFNFDFTVANEAEEYCITVTNLTYNSIFYSDCFEVTPGNCCSYSFGYNDLPLQGLYEHCDDFKITVSSKNYCFENYASDEVIWDRELTPISYNQATNVASIPYPTNECFIIDGISGADECHVIVQNQWGDELINRVMDVTSPQLCIWDGYFCDFPFGCNYAVPGVYYFIIELTNCDGSTIDFAYYGTIFWDQGFNGMNLLDPFENTQITFANTDTANENNLLQIGFVEKNNEKIHVYPNPTQDIIHLTYESDFAFERYDLVIFDNVGKQIFTSKEKLSSVDLSSFSNGIYFIEIKTESGIFREKIIKN